MKDAPGFLLLALIVLATACPAFGQQNLFNVPSGEITAENDFFIQEQVNITATTTQSNTTLDYGIGHGTEIGLNVFFLNYDSALPLRNQGNSADNSIPVAPLVLANIQTGTRPDAAWRASAGMQAGAGAGGANPGQFAYQAYAMTSYQEPFAQIRIHVGVYHGNEAYNGRGDGLLMGGIEWPLIKSKLHILADIIQGSHANAVAVPGILWYIDPHIGFSLGWQKPFPNSRTEEAIVFELSIF